MSALQAVVTQNKREWNLHKHGIIARRFVENVLDVRYFFGQCKTAYYKRWVKTLVLDSFMKYTFK